MFRRTEHRHPEARADRRASKDGRECGGRSSFEALASLGRLRMTVLSLQRL